MSHDWTKAAIAVDYLLAVAPGGDANGIRWVLTSLRLDLGFATGDRVVLRPTEGQSNWHLVVVGPVRRVDTGLMAEVVRYL